MTELEKLKNENKALRKKLAVVKAWMERGLKNQVNAISKRKVNKMTMETKNYFLKENIEEIITKKINKFFGDIMIMNMPSGIVENIISAEINYYNLKQNPDLDGFSVISSYHKALDTLIENYITRCYRKYAKKSGQIYLRKNDLLEKSLHSVVNQGFILSTGRLFHLTKLIKNGEEIHDYGKCFNKYLNKFDYLKEVLLDEDFYSKFEEIINSEVLGKKRHSGNINFEETTLARNMLLGGFKDKSCLIYKLVETQNTYY